MLQSPDNINAIVMVIEQTENQKITENGHKSEKKRWLVFG